MNDLKDIPTFILLEMCKGYWNLYPVPIQAEYVSKEMKQWCDDVKNAMIEKFKEELDRRKSNPTLFEVEPPTGLLKKYIDHLRDNWALLKEPPEDKK